MLVNFPGPEFWGTTLQLRKRKKNDKCRGVFTFKQPHILTKNCHFMVVKGYRDIKLETEPKSVLHERKLVVFAFYHSGC